MNELLNDYPVTMEIPIAWGDMDAFQHVNNVVYFKHFQSARIAYLDEIDFVNFENQTRIGSILSATQCKYIIPLTYPDRVTVGSKVDDIKDYSFIMKYAVVSHKHKRIAAIGTGTIVTYDYHNNVKVLVPDEIKNRIMLLEKGVLSKK